MNELKQLLLTRGDVSKLLYHFYGKIEQDRQLAPFFVEVLGEHKTKHMEKLIDFWEMQLFGLNNYAGNPMQVHKDLHQRSPLSSELFDLWLRLFKESVNELFEGENAATVMKMKVLY
jgi:hemoglobin